jgi:alpha-ribazole phosphatase
MEVYLVRHTETVCEKGICYGQADVEIKEPYETLFEEIKEGLPKDALVFSSPLQRCTRLAHYIMEQPIKTDSRLMEMNFGSWELQNWNDIPEFELTPWMQDFVSVQVPNGESFTQLYQRVVSFINDLKPLTNDKVILITHAGVIRSFLCYYQNLPLKDAFQNKVAFGEIIKITI